MSRSFNKFGEVSSVNSSATLITDTSNFTGAWEDASKWDSVTIAVSTDQDGYYEIQFSPDGTNQDSTLTRYYRTAQFNVPHRFTITRQFFRVVFYNNSGADQTYFRLQSMYGLKGDLNIPIDSTMAQDFDSISTRPTDYHSEAALNRRQGVTVWSKFGYNNDVDTGTSEVVASFGGAFQFLSSAETLDIVSTSANDTNSGTGVHGLVIYGVDGDWNSAIEVVFLTGTTTVTTTSTWLGINRISAYRAGTGQSNAGVIDITATTALIPLAQMPLGEGTSQQCILYIPRAHKFLANWIDVSILKLSGGGGAPEVTVRGWVYSAVSNCKYEVYKGKLDVALSNQLDVHPQEHFLVDEKSIFWLECETDSNNTAVQGRFSGKLHRNPSA